MKIRSLLAISSVLYLFLQVFYQNVRGDIYLHVPRGSNNRLKGENQNRDNNNRVFDSQVYFQGHSSFVRTAENSFDNEILTFQAVTEGGKPENPAKNPWSRRDQLNSTHMSPKLENGVVPRRSPIQVERQRPNSTRHPCYVVFMSLTSVLANLRELEQARTTTAI